MKINYDFYTGKDLYSDGNIEDEIIKYEKQNIDVEEIFKKDIRWPVFYHLTPIRQNIINWYPFSKETEILEIGAGMGAITGALCEKCKSVVSVELSKNRATSIATRNQDKDNLEIIVANLNDINFKNRKFDYITLIGVLEYAPLYTNSENPFEDFLTKIKRLLKPDGKILIAIENKFGMKYFLGAPEDHTNVKYDGITGYQNDKTVQTFGKEEIKNVLKKVGLNYTKFYYPLPDYKLPAVIFSDDYLPNEETIEKYTPYYYEGTQIEFDEISAYKEIIKNKMFDFFANSFFIECSEKIIDTKIELENIKLKEAGEYSKKFYDKDYSKKYEAISKKELEKLENENHNLKLKIQAIENSKTWKVMKSIRKIKKKIRK